MPIKLAVWDIDDVWYKGVSTTHVAKGSSTDITPYLTVYTDDKKWFTSEDVNAWQAATGRQLHSPGDVADMFADFLYNPKFRNTVYAGVSDQDAKTRTIEGKQMLLRGLTIGQVKKIADGVPYANGLQEALQTIKRGGAQQIGFSDGLGPFVAYKMLQNDISIGGVVPAILDTDYGEDWFNPITAVDLLQRDSAQLTGRVGPFRKSEAIFDYLSTFGYPIEEVAAIDDSAANLNTLKKIRDGGGVAVGVNVNDREKFEAAGIPVIKGDNLFLFAEIVRNRNKIGEHCETWGLEI